MSDFEYDCLQKKRLAGQAKYRKRGSKSKKCNLPSDRMTRKQWKERCGPVMTYNMSKPMAWENFKKLSKSTQAEYINTLQQRYGATAVDLGRMFGVQALTVRKHAIANSLEVSFPRGHAMTTLQRAEWEKFLNDSNDNIVPDFVEQEENNSNDTLTESENNQFINSHSDVINEAAKMDMKRFSIQFSGSIDVDMVANSLKLILGQQAEGELEIICTLS